MQIIPNFYLLEQDGPASLKGREMAISTSFNFSVINSTVSNEYRTPQKGSVAVLPASCVEITLCLLGTFGYSLTIIIICQFRSLQVVSNLLLASLAFADLLVSAILVPMRASQHMAFYLGTTVPQTVIEIAGFVGRVNIIASISSLIAMSIDRYIALSYPIFYLSSVKLAKGKACLVILLRSGLPPSLWLVCQNFLTLATTESFLVFFVAVCPDYNTHHCGGLLQHFQDCAQIYKTTQNNQAGNKGRAFVSDYYLRLTSLLLLWGKQQWAKWQAGLRSEKGAKNGEHDRYCDWSVCSFGVFPYYLNPISFRSTRNRG